MKILFVYNLNEILGVRRRECFPSMHVELNVMFHEQLMMQRPRRVNVDAFKALVDSMTDEELARQQELDFKKSETEHAHFVEGYRKGMCYLCVKPFKTISKDHPCVHWLLRQGKFKKKDLPAIYHRFGYTQMAAFTRWVANQERFQGNINDLLEEKGKKKLIEFTVKWKNIEWTFDCSRSDYEGHGGLHSNFPHYHLQMRIDGRPFINFGDFHIPFSEEDLFHIDLTLTVPNKFHHTFGLGGLGMQSAAEMDPEEIIRNTVVTDNEDQATYHMRTMILAKDNPIDGEILKAMFDESCKTGESIASLARKYFPNADSIKTVVSPADTIPNIARRTERNR